MTADERRDYTVQLELPLRPPAPRSTMTSQYTVMVDDNFHYMDEDERYQFGTFPTAEEAVAACRKIVDDWLKSSIKPGMSAKDLYELYVCFGEDPFVIPTDRTTAEDEALWHFSAWNYAEQRAKVLCTS